MLSEKMENLKNYLEDEKNFMELVDLIEEIFWETGSLEWLKVHNMDEFDGIYCEYEKNEIAELIENSSRTFTISDDLFIISKCFTANFLRSISNTSEIVFVCCPL